MSSSKPAARKKTGATRKPTAAKSLAKLAAVVNAKPTKRKPTKRMSPARKAAKAAVPNGAVSDQMTATAAAIEAAIAGDLATLDNESLQKLMAAAVKAYSAKREAGETFLPVNAAGRVTPTDIMLTSSQLLRAGNLQVFELGMWQSWTGN
jgi:hypothetical protein